MVTFDQISKSFKSNFWDPPFYALKDVSFHIEQGSVVGLLGENGSGKTTLFKILVGLISPSSGELNWKLSKRKERMTFLPEKIFLPPFLTGREYLEYLSQLYKLDKPTREKNIGYWSDRLKIDHALSMQCKKYSKGMFQRLGIVGNLILNPELMIFDEPLSGLDPVGRKEIKELLLEIQKKGTTIIISSHIIHDIEMICEDIIFLEKGKIIYDGKIERIINESDHGPYITSFYLEGALDFPFPIEVLKSNSIDNYHVCRIQKDYYHEGIKEVISRGGRVLNLNQEYSDLESILYRVKHEGT